MSRRVYGGIKLRRLEHLWMIWDAKRIKFTATSSRVERIRSLERSLMAEVGSGRMRVKRKNWPLYTLYGVVVLMDVIGDPIPCLVTTIKSSTNTCVIRAR